MVLGAILTDKSTSNDPVFKYSVEVKEFNLPQPQPDQTVIKIQAAAFNHRYIYTHLVNN